jgi:hypothetical protein
VYGCGRCDLLTLVCRLTADGLQSAACDGRRCCRISRCGKKICVGRFVFVAVHAAQTLHVDHILLSKQWMDVNEKLV